jgi:hypothetical protein
MQETQQVEATGPQIFTHNGDAHYLITEDKSLIGSLTINNLGGAQRDYPKESTHL